MTIGFPPLNLMLKFNLHCEVSHKRNKEAQPGILCAQQDPRQT